MPAPNLRDSAGSVELHGGTGEILQMVGLANYLEAYKADTTFRVQTPQTVDPHNTNPNAPWVVTRIEGVKKGVRFIYFAQGSLSASCHRQLGPRAANHWKTAMNPFAILYEDRFTK